MILLSVVNLILFACFGLISLVKAYEFYNNQYIPFITEQINERNEKARIAAEKAITKEQEEREKIIETEVQRRLALAKKELVHERNDINNVNSRSDVLESCMDNCSISTDCESVVVDGDNSCDSILGGSIYTSDNVTINVDNVIEENI
jgi:hypothetical protein